MSYVGFCCSMPGLCELFELLFCSTSSWVLRLDVSILAGVVGQGWGWSVVLWCVQCCVLSILAGEVGQGWGWSVVLCCVQCRVLLILAGEGWNGWY